MRIQLLGAAALSVLLAQCASDDPEGLAQSQAAQTTVKYDFFHKPLPDIPLPNDIATVFDATSATGRRINASMVAPTGYERRTRELIDKLDGWGIFQSISIPFTGPLDVNSILAGHREADYASDNDVVYLFNIDRDSAEFGKLHHLDVGNGNYPIVLEDRSRYWENDPRAGTMSILFEEVDEDANRNGQLDPGEDTDADGVLDRPNYLPGASPAANDVAARADALMAFYERETNTLIVRPLVPLRERTTYAVVVTKRILDAHGRPVGSPYPSINHTAQTEALKPLPEVLGQHGLGLDDVAFTFTFTTQSVQSHWQAVRDGLHGHGVQGHLGREFPPEVDEIYDLRDDPNLRAPHLFYGETWRQVGGIIAATFLGLNVNSREYRVLDDSLKYVDYFVIGRYRSPQLYPRHDAQGNFLHLNDQSWPPDLDRVPAPARSEDVWFTLSVPRKEISARGQGQPAPVVLLGHGYGGPRFTIMQFAGYLAKHGLATIAIDGPSHGIGLSAEEEALARGIFESRGLGNLVEATLLDRAFDQNGDGRKDSGADFWTSYLFHCRDIVRQFMLDYSQLVRVMRSWDGQRQWGFDLGHDGQPDVAGDFDGDGALDIGGDAPIMMTGASLGGIMSMLMGGTEPDISTVVPIAGGGGYSDMGMRTLQGGALEAFVLRGMGPLYSGNVDGSGVMTLDTIVVDLVDDVRRRLGTIANVRAGDTLVVENLVSGARGCGQVSPTGRVRASLESDKGDRIRALIYDGPQLLPEEGCHLRDGAQPKGILEELIADFTYQGVAYHQGDPLVALEDGLGRERNTPEMRRLQSIAQMVLDPGDPASYARHLLDEPLHYPGTNQSTGAHALIMTSQGDMNVPAASGVTFGRAAGLIGYLEPDPRYGVPQNQVFLDTYTAEAVDNLARFTDGSGKGVHLDVENFGGSNDFWGPEYPRLDPPIRAGLERRDNLGGESAAFFPLTRDTGQHGFDFPGAMTDQARQRCRNSCTLPGSGDPCGCATLESYDIGSFLVNMMGHYLRTDGQEIRTDLCQSNDTCEDRLPAPEARNLSELP